MYYFLNYTYILLLHLCILIISYGKLINIMGIQHSFICQKYYFMMTTLSKEIINSIFHKTNNNIVMCKVLFKGLKLINYINLITVIVTILMVVLIRLVQIPAGPATQNCHIFPNNLEL